MSKRLWILFALFLLICSSALHAQSGTRNFDHVKTGFALTGLHSNARCESCHMAGVFKGTPKDCASCHINGSRLSRSNVTKPSAHFQTQLGCDSCHTTVTFVGSKFDHAGIAANSCGSCHNGATTVGKPSGHIQTTASCGTCHKTSGWLPASGLDHAGFTSATNCASCHNGGTATGKTATHIPTSVNCISCHATSGWKPTSWNHGQMPVANQCSTCHSGGFLPADGPTVNHIPYKSLSGVSIANCDSCHKGGYTSWNPGQFHANVPVSTQCATCHMSTSFGVTARPATAIHSGQTVCENCHKSTSTWSGSKPDHSLFNSATNCSSCHNGSAATGKVGTHIPTSVNCISCHNTTGWKPSTWNHSQMAVANQCSSCHTGGFPPASGPTTNHIPYKSLSGVSIANCDSCHKGGYTSWNPGAFHANVSVSTQCATCHMNTSFGATGRPSTAVHNGQSVCESCHKSTSTWLGGAKPDHSGFTSATNCSTCHNGSSATGKTASHVPTSVNCISCHATSGWKPTSWNHGQMPVANQCSTCHSGGFLPADGPTVNHIPYKSLSGVSIANCDSCHKGGYTSWNPGAFHANVPVSTQCATCHMSTSFGVTARPTTPIHNGQSVCETCHKSTSTWSGSKPDHGLFNSATNCSSCHNGSAATGKVGTHIPTGVNCISCHATTGWKPTKWNHSQAQVVNQCSSCHTGGFPPASGPTTNHIPYKSLSGVTISNCDSCHKAGYTSWNPGVFHANVPVSTQCATCHMSTSFGVTVRPNTAIHNGQTVCEGCHKSTSTWSGSKPDHGLFNSATNCSGCHNGSAATGKINTHIPTGVNCVSCHNVTGWKPTKWNHTQMTVTNQCSTCHSGAYPPADGKTVNHIPYTSLTGVAITNCDSCHKAGYTSWNPGVFHANVPVSTQCATCHMSTSFGVTVRPNTAIHNGQTVCEGCHKSTSTWSGSKPDHTLFNNATNCSGCHNGSAATGQINTHIPTGVNCVSCHNVTGWKPTKWNHTQMTVTNQCSTCHSGAYPPADGKTVNHIPYTSLTGVAITNCDSCHKAGYSSWNPGSFHRNVSLSTQCATCHMSSNYGLSSRPATAIHNGQTVCEGCHKSTSTWLGSKPDHSLFTAATVCSSCHNGSAAIGTTATHILTSVNCVSCHSVTGWKPTKWNHTQMPVTNQCSTCHSGAYPPADGKPLNHIPYQSLTGVGITNCDSCHKAGYSSWNPGSFHRNVSLSTQCATCHMSSNYGLSSRPATAIHNGQTVCEGCHKSTSTWLGSKPDHSLFTAATVCSSCHNGSAAIGKTATHILTSVNCVSCHSVTSWKPTKWNHTQMLVTNQCSTCHSGAYPPAEGKPLNHIPYQSLTGVAITNCDSCHKSGYSSWIPGMFHNNVSLSTQCATCHMSASYGLSSRPPTAIHNGQTVCEGCHKSTSTWLGSKPDHSLFTAATVCSSCHNGSAAIGKTATHILTSVNCVSCHSVTGWKPTKWNHTQMLVTNQCSTCHSGAYPPADGKPLNHIPYQSLTGVAITNCDSCHKAGYSSWIPGMFHRNVSVTTQCATCHMSASYGLSSRPPTAIHNGQTVCEGCHKSTSTWLGSKPDHSLFTAATVCSSCHNGSAAIGKTATHILTSVNCVSCHSVTGWKPTKWNHTQMAVTNQCSTCHSGAYPPADGKPLNHIPYQSLTGVAITNCDSCHKAGYSSWNPGSFHRNVSIATQCATCHLTGGYGLTSKPASATHSTVTGNCESCHRSTSSWLSVQYTHAPANALGTGTCDNCHNGSTSAVSKKATHIPIPAGIAKCDSCHRSQVSFATSVTMNHSVVTAGTCKSCHNGGYLSAGAQGALAKPANHIPEAQLTGGAALDCNACHSSTTSWLTERMNHTSTMGNGAGWCKTCHQTGVTYLGTADKMQLNHRNKTPAPTDCSQSGCHRPLGNTGSTYTKWN